jgi:hypothetical protein
VKLLLDTGVLGEFCHPNTKKYLPKINLFLNHIEQGKHGVFIPEIADYELRRELLRFARQNNQTTSRSLERLDHLVRVYGTPEAWCNNPDGTPEAWCNNPDGTPEARRNLNLKNLIVE